MGYICVCDLCGKPILGKDKSEQYKFKKLCVSWHEYWWTKIDVHEDCRKKLFHALEESDKTPIGETSEQNK